MERITVKGKALVDESGRERIFNGVNLVFKGNEIDGKENFKPVDWTPDMFKRLSELGINVVRFGLLWKAVQPRPDFYDEDYLDCMERYVDLCNQYGIYVYLDMHQDLYHGGAPDWATVTDSYNFKKAKLIWAEGYFFDKAVHRAFDNFWANLPVCGKGLQDHYADMWKHVAERFKDKENLLGFDIFNEPYPGTDGGKAFRKIVKSATKTILSKKVKKVQAIKNIIKGDTATEALAIIDDPEVFRSATSGADLFIKKFDTETYYPFLVKIASAIREVTENGIIFMENCYYSNTTIPCSTPRLRYPDGKLEENLVFSPHGYDLTVDSVMTNVASNSRADTIFAQHAKTQARLGVPVLVGEWGGMVPGCDDYPHLEHLLELFDNNHWSQTYWAFWPALAEEKIMKIIARPYPVAVPGEIQKYGFNRRNNTFTLKFTTEKLTRKKVMIYAPTMPREIISERKATIHPIGDSEAVYISVTPVKGENEIIVKL